MKKIKVALKDTQISLIRDALRFYGDPIRYDTLAPKNKPLLEKTMDDLFGVLLDAGFSYADADPVADVDASSMARLQDGQRTKRASHHVS